MRFVSKRTNIQNHPRTVKLVYKGIEFALADFIIQITGGSNASSITGFIRSRIVERGCTVSQCLNELYLHRNDTSLWPSLAVKEYFLTWYGNEVTEQMERRKICERSE